MPSPSWRRGARTVHGRIWLARLRRAYIPFTALAPCWLSRGRAIQRPDAPLPAYLPISFEMAMQSLNCMATD